MADQAILKTNHGDITLTLFPNHAPETVANFAGLADGHQGVRRRQRPQRPVLRRPHVPPGHPRLHDPGRLPARHRHRRPRLHLQGRAPPRAGLRQALPARDGQRRPRHQRLAVLHHRRRDPVAELQAHDLRRGRRPGLARRGRRDRRHPHRGRRPAGRARGHRVRRGQSAPEHRPLVRRRPPARGCRPATGTPTGSPTSAASGATGRSAPTACATPRWASTARRASPRARSRPGRVARRTAACAPATRRSPRWC